MLNNTRIKEDLLSTRKVPTDACYGVHTLRATENFYISNNKISDTPEFVRGMVMVKKAATMTNKELQAIPESVTNAIIAACDEVLDNGKCMNQFPVNIYQGGVGTPVNMNTNEILVNIGLELIGRQKGGYQYLNPNDHTNKCQSTSDVYPAGFRIIVYASIIKLIDALNQLREGFGEEAAELQDILEVGRIQLQDAVPMTFSQEFHAFSALLKEEVRNISCTAELPLEANLDATAIDTGLNTPKEHSPLVVRELVEVTGLACVPAEDLIETTSDCGVYIMMHGTLKRLVVKMPKICNNLCLLSLGPRAGLNEINLSEPQAGSSIMLARVNPVVPKVVNRVCFKVIGNDITVTMTSEASQPQLNVMKPIIGQTMFEPIHVLSNAYYNLLEKCVSGTTANKEVYEAFVFNSISIVIYFNPFTGHRSGDIASKICAETGKSVREVVLERGLLTESELDDIFSVQNLMYPVYRAKRYTDESGQ